MYELGLGVPADLELARTFADSMQCAFFPLSLTDLKSGYIGQSGENVKALWQKARGEARGIVPSQPFSAAALAAAQASGKPVFVWMTADWCLTCKVNERVAIEREDTRAAFARAGVMVLKGDWTRRDPEITRYLAGRGAAGVPLYVWYPGGAAAPVTLPQLLTPESLTALPGKK